MGMYTELQRSALPPFWTIREGEFDACCPVRPRFKRSFQAWKSKVLIGWPADQPTMRRRAEFWELNGMQPKGIGSELIGAQSQGFKLSCPWGWAAIPHPDVVEIIQMLK